MTDIATARQTYIHSANTCKQTNRQRSPQADNKQTNQLTTNKSAKHQEEARAAKARVTSGAEFVGLLQFLADYADLGK